MPSPHSQVLMPGKREVEWGLALLLDLKTHRHQPEWIYILDLESESACSLNGVHQFVQSQVKSAFYVCSWLEKMKEDFMMCEKYVKFEFHCP